jgi:hypothetical protein
VRVVAGGGLGAAIPQPPDDLPSGAQKITIDLNVPVPGTRQVYTFSCSSFSGRMVALKRKYPVLGPAPPHRAPEIIGMTFKEPLTL